MQQTLPQLPVHPALPALPAQPAAAMPNNFCNYARPVTAIQSISAKVSDPSSQVQVRDEEIELLHAQIEHLQQVNFLEFVTSNSQNTAQPTSSLGSACMKHLLQTFANLEPECQAGSFVLFP